ncbi:MAG: hypothetical protein IKH37_06240 [Prevotella sp.]|nr:hypothetical protein [Prevotella sp.]
MSRYVRDPWAKKTKKGMKTLGKMAKVGSALGAAAYYDVKQTNAKAKQTDFSVIPIAGKITFLVGVIFAIYIMYSAENFILGFLYFFGILFLTVIATVIVSLVFPNSSNDSDSTASTSTAISQPVKPTYSEDKANLLKSQIVQMKPLEDVNRIVLEIESSDIQRETLKKALDMALGEIKALDEIPSSMENYIKSLMERFSLKDDETESSKNYVEYVKALVIQDILKGRIPKRVTLDNSPINMQAGEVTIWAFVNVVYYEEVSKRTTVGASKGFSVRIAKGIYYREGAFKGEPLITSSLQAKYSGALILTNRNIYFYSAARSMKFPYKKIISFVPFEDGLGVQPDRTNAKTVYFKNLDGRFAFNIVSNINNLS